MRRSAAPLNNTLVPEDGTAATVSAKGGVGLRGSPGIGSGPDGFDMGAKVPGGAWVTGAPTGATGRDSATLAVAGPGVTHYKYRVDGGAWSEEAPVSAPLQLSDLSDGAHSLHVVGKNAAGRWQDEPTTKTWTVNTALPTVRLSEVLAVNAAAEAAAVQVASASAPPAAFGDAPTGPARTPSPSPALAAAQAARARRAGAIFFDQAGGDVLGRQE